MSTDYAKIQLRRATEAQFIAANTMLASGEPSFATDTKIIKVGDSVTAWQNLPNTVISNVSGITNASGVYNLVAMSQSDYDGLGSYDPKTIYFIR
jgi:hypothetical protein